MSNHICNIAHTAAHHDGAQALDARLQFFVFCKVIYKYLPALL